MPTNVVKIYIYIPKYRNHHLTSSPRLQEVNTHDLAKLKEGSGHSSKTEQNKRDKRKRTTVTLQLTLVGNHIIQKKKV